MTAQSGTVYRYVRADADHDISGDTFECSLDDETWTAVTYVAQADWPPSVIKADADNPSTTIGHWWRLLTGPATPFPFQRGYNVLLGHCVDSPEMPDFAWRIVVGPHE